MKYSIIHLVLAGININEKMVSKNSFLLKLKDGFHMSNNNNNKNSSEQFKYTENKFQKKLIEAIGILDNIIYL